MKHLLPDSLDFQDLYDELLMIPRSISGPGYLKSLKILRRYIPFELERYPSGSKVLDWTVPPEWKLERALLKDTGGNIILDSDVNPLYVLNYSTSFQGTVTRAELEDHLFTDSRHPDQIPYVTSYYRDRWGFCMSSKMKEQLTDTHYEVDIRAEKDNDGEILVGVCDLPGMSDRIVQFSSYLCHPNMLNNELSGPLTLVLMWLLLSSLPRESRRYTYRFVINPETIGAICYLSRHGDELKEKLEYGINVTCTASFYSNDYAGNFSRIKPVDLTLLKEHLASESIKLKAEPDLNSCNGSLNGSQKAAGGCSSHSCTDTHSCFNKLIAQFKECSERNFLPFPMTFKMTRQSLTDEIKYVRSSVMAEACAVCAGSRAQSDIDCCADDGARRFVSPAPAWKDKEILKSAMTCITDEEKSGHYMLNGGLHSGLSDDHRMALMNWFISDHLKIPSVNKIVTSDDASCNPAVKHSCTVDHVIAVLEKSSQSNIKSCVFMPYSGSDERQYCSALINLPVASAFLTAYGSYGEYHSSRDSQELFSLDSIIWSAIQLVMFSRFYERREEKPKALIPGEPQLGPRDLYPSLSCRANDGPLHGSSVWSVLNIITLLNLADGQYTVEELSGILDIPAFEMLDLIDLLRCKELLA